MVDRMKYYVSKIIYTKVDYEAQTPVTQHASYYVHKAPEWGNDVMVEDVDWESLPRLFVKALLKDGFERDLNTRDLVYNYNLDRKDESLLDDDGVSLVISREGVFTPKEKGELEVNICTEYSKAMKELHGYTSN